ncbi:hypothetical protein [uncultured Porphyromonas sp.]|uniref:hypothetical protein n=1 Tax=uncultured Porphyromonas sp. TaxID=159274 RepID=UPI0028058536|nr:hypothetical protein [uncultured Porphyromonas sp.]
MMKERLTRLILSTMLLALSSLCLAAQEVVVPGEPEPPTPEKRNEVRLNLYAPLPFQAVALEYERALALDVGVGVMASAYFGPNRFNVVFFPTAGVMPYGRWYFGGVLFSMKKPNAGFFLEANSSIAYNDNLRNVHYEYSSETEKWEKQIEERSGVSWGIGLGGGFKLVTRSNWSGEISCRLGRNIVKVSKWNIAYIYPAISVGYRF